MELAAEVVAWCGENMRAVYKAGTEVNAKPRIERLDREVLAAGLEGREIAADVGAELRDEWIETDAATFSKACQRAYDRRR